MENSQLLGYDNLFNKLRNREGADWTVPPEDYKKFIEETQKLFVRKDTDYDSRFIRGMVDTDMNARTLWAWEVDKKLDRLRSWIERGELQVKGEGIRNSVDDLFIYTVQYVAFVQAIINNQEPAKRFLERVRHDRNGFFHWNACRLNPKEWVEFLVVKGRIKENELLLQNIILSYMGHPLTKEDWQLAIRALLS
ncbi:hypothetical protein [Lysinibacillus sp. 54212]|uniref:hypothetical protein n=1 Tax=Lysinibacillus sp. 54212 TaxID=3119829 RepID=UPI002FCBFEE6